jgi:hypothetical protein
MLEPHQVHNCAESAYSKPNSASCCSRSLVQIDYAAQINNWEEWKAFTLLSRSWMWNVCRNLFFSPLSFAGDVALQLGAFLPQRHNTTISANLSHGISFHTPLISPGQIAVLSGACYRFVYVWQHHVNNWLDDWRRDAVHVPKAHNSCKQQ